MAHYYGWSSFSVRTMVAGALRDGLHRRQAIPSSAQLGVEIYLISLWVT